MSLHSLPFHIEYNGTAEVESAFSVTVAKDEKQLSSSFRGRRLKGKLQDKLSNICCNIGMLDTNNGF